MNLLCTSKFDIGTMGQLMVILENIEIKVQQPLDEIENIMISNNGKLVNANPFKYIFIENKSITDQINLYIEPIKHPYRELIPPDKILRYKTIISKLILNSEITERFNRIKKEILINETFLGVHVRLSDMNPVHGNDYGCTYFEDFTKAIDIAMKTDKYTKIFIASDTQEAILKLKKIYGDTMVCYDDFIRLNKEYGDLSRFIKENLPTNKKWIQDTFIEMLLLAECGGLIHRVTNFANIAKVYSNTIKDVYFLKGVPLSTSDITPFYSKSGDFIIYIEDGEIRAKKTL